MIVYIHPKCTTCKKALKWFELNDVKFEQKDIRETPPTAKELLKIKKTQNLEWKKMANTSGELYRSLGLKDKLPEMSDKEASELLAGNGMLIKRPLVLDNGERHSGSKKKFTKRNGRDKMKKYSENGLWIKQDGSEYVIGLSPKGQDDLGDVSFVELLKSEAVTPEDSIISVEAAKAVTELLAPLSGTVVAFHDELEENPEFLNELAEEKNWIVRLNGVDEAEFNALLDEDLPCEQCEVK